jgi:hypothetical protein
MAASFSQQLTDVLEVHQQRMNGLIGFVRRTAANLMSVTLRDADEADTFEFRHEPYWVLSGQSEALGSIAPGTFDRFLPKSTPQGADSKAYSDRDRYDRAAQRRKPALGEPAKR